MNVERFLARRLPLILGIGGGIILLNLGVYLFGVSRLDKFAQGVKDKVAANRRVLKSSEDQSKTLSASVERVQTDKKVIGELSDKIFETRSKRLVTVQTEIQKLITANKLDMQTISYGYKTYPSKRDKEGWEHRYLKVSMQIPLTGTYPEIKKFIHDLQASPQFFIIDQLSLSSSAQGGVELKVNLAVSTYFIATSADVARGERGGAA